VCLCRIDLMCVVICVFLIFIINEYASACLAQFETGACMCVCVRLCVCSHACVRACAGVCV